MGPVPPKRRLLAESTRAFAAACGGRALGPPVTGGLGGGCASSRENQQVSQNVVKSDVDI